MIQRGILIAALILIASATNWAVLTAGSSGFSNYRHQSDVFHAYQVLLKRGFNPENIVVLAYDDIASSTSNPYKGKVYNKPTFKDPGVDVYAGVKIDYVGKHVTPKVFINVLLGNESYVKGMGSGRVLNSTASDNVFIFFSDHGSPGSISFPSGHLMADEFIATLKGMVGRFQKLVFYLETCESGSMFVKLPTNLGIYALSAAGTSESSWATYCSPDDVIGGKHIKSCLGDLFSVSFIEDLDTSASADDNLQQQFERVKKRTTESKVMQWGDKSFTTDSLVDFFGVLKPSTETTKTSLFGSMTQMMRERKGYHKVSTYNTKIHYLMATYKAEPTEENERLLREEYAHMNKMDKIFGKIKSELNLNDQFDVENIKFDCYRDSVEFFETNCA